MRSIATLAFAALIAVAGFEARAQDGYPSQVVKVVVPAAAGSTTDTETAVSSPFNLRAMSARDAHGQISAT